MADARASAAAERLAIAAACRLPESECVPPLLAAAAPTPAVLARAELLARTLVAGIHSRPQRFGIETLLREFPLSSERGVALLSLAEALLRIPDAENAERLLRDKLERFEWRSHERAGLMTRVIGWGARWRGGALRRWTAGAVLEHLGGQFVFAQSIEAALMRSHRERARGYRHSFDMLGEAAVTAADAQHYFEAYQHAIDVLGRRSQRRGVRMESSISVKLSALHPRFQYSQREWLGPELIPRVRALAVLAKHYDIGLTIDAEESERLELTLDVFESLACDAALSGWNGLGIAVQAYQKRASAVIDFLLDLARRGARRVSVRLVKGAYWDSEIKRAQLDGVEDFPVYTRKAHTDLAYIACAKRLLAHKDEVFPQFGTHNVLTVATIIALGGDSYGPDDYEFQCLYGMGAALYDQVIRAGPFSRPCRIYAPVGAHDALLSYLMRRLFENGASASFVHRLNDPNVSLDSLLADPSAITAAHGAHGSARIALPRALFEPERRNSAGFDLADEGTCTRLLQALRLERTRVRSLDVTDAAALDAALAAAPMAAQSWAAWPPSQRAATLERASDLFEREHELLIALTMREGGKTLSSAVAELREAVDYLRYYACQIRTEFNNDTHRALGVVACISPWNFPLAIFTGQIAGALAAGNAVLAKPAEQTPLIAAQCVGLLHAAGVPRETLQLLPGDGPSVGAPLVADARVDGVVFTGSTQTAKAIERALAARAGLARPLIAETGGQNAMIVDSSALAEQVISDALTSAFDSAGQRCSALRVLCVQREIAPQIIAMLEGAMRELRVGDVQDIATDVGPIIDDEARDRIAEHIERMRLAGRVRYQTELPPSCRNGLFIPPTLIEIESISELSAEVFGPVLHVTRFDRSQLAQLISSINATGYGLTLGIHSRIDDTIQYILARARAGNVYVNRNMIGAVVGVQPFGGWGLSGTGPKAGGRFFLHRVSRQSPGVLRQGEAPEELQGLIDWLRGIGSTHLPSAERLRLIEYALRYQRHAPVRWREALRGPVGESNELRLCPRGVAVATGHSVVALLHQLAATLATGNDFRVTDIALAGQLRRLLPNLLQPHIQSGNDSCDMVLVDGEEARAQASWVQGLQQQLAWGDGVIVPLIQSDPDYALERLMLEQTISINTAAVGGNAAFLAQESD